MIDPARALAASFSDEVIREILPVISAAERDALRRYQALDRTYELVNQVLRGERHPGTLSADEALAGREIARGLTEMLRRWRTPKAVVAYRGVRSRSRLDLAAGRLLSNSFLSTALFRVVAVDEFTVPAGADGPALMEIAIPSGMPAVWVPPLGDPALAYQGELLLDRGATVVVRGSRDEDGILVVDCEVEPLADL